MNYTYVSTRLNGNQIRYQFYKSKNTKLTYGEFIDLSGSRDFVEVLRRALNHATNELNSAYLWECLPVSRKSLDNPFEFVVTKSSALNSIRQNYSSFQEHINKNKYNQVCSFKNLGGDATLVVPVPQSNKDYKNLSNFTQNAPLQQQHQFWQEVGRKLSENLSETPKWLSTNGLGVHYLHIRIDRTPKYYSFDEYRREVFAKHREEPGSKRDEFWKSPASWTSDRRLPWEENKKDDNSGQEEKMEGVEISSSVHDNSRPLFNSEKLENIKNNPQNWRIDKIIVDLEKNKKEVILIGESVIRLDDCYQENGKLNFDKNNLYRWEDLNCPERFELAKIKNISDEYLVGDEIEWLIKEVESNPNVWRIGVVNERDCLAHSLAQGKNTKEFNTLIYYKEIFSRSEWLKINQILSKKQTNQPISRSGTSSDQKAQQQQKDFSHHPYFPSRRGGGGKY